MNERDIFIAALEKSTAEQRLEFLSVACGGDSQLRQSVEALLQTHEQTSDFLEKPLVERLAEGVAALEEAAETAHEPAGSAELGFLSPSDQPGSLGRLGHYEVQEVIGSGGMGIVLRAFDQRLHRIVAIKVMAGQLATNAAARKRFLREARAAAAVCHDHIVTIHAVEESGELPYLVMQCVAGMSLQQRIDRDGPLALHEILRIGMQTAAGLAAAHAQGLIHRDIKPANILLENGVERVRITDFGLARAAADASVSQPGIVAGTPQYMAPEQARGEALDCRTDLFSLGSVLYAMCTGRAPFRAANSMAVLKRVCDEAPSPIREANADVPEWLIELIDKLQAKNPDDRYQSAAEVADLLGRRLAQLQHSTPLPPLAPAKPAPSRPAARRLRTWAVAAAVLLAVLATFAIAEGTGVTQVAATVIRLMTPDGTLVVETDDPAVKVTIEGDGGLVIKGAGLEEIRLRPGSYRVQADRNGQPVALDKDLVTVSRGGRAIVKVKLETSPAVEAAKVENGAFVLLGGTGVAERKFDALAEAVLAGSDGDTIEVRGNGPFVSPPVSIGRIGLTIRAATGFRPVIKGNANRTVQVVPYLLHKGPLVLEGLELHMTGPVGSRSVHSVQAPLHVANCRFVVNPSHSLFADTPDFTVRNCEFVGTSSGGILVKLHLPNNGKMILENNFFSAPFGHALDLFWVRPDLHNLAIHLQHNTVATRRVAIVQNLIVVPESAKPGAATDRQPVQMHVSANLFDSIDPTDSIFSLLLPPDWYDKDAKSLSANEAEGLLPRLMAWREERNLYCKGLSFQAMRRVTDPSGPEREYSDEPLPAFKTLADWQRMWNTGDSGSAEGVIRYERGDVLAKMEATPELITAEDFRLRPDSLGYRAGPDGKDLGADVDLVGPGAAYERWKQTPAYQEWLKETGQKK